MARPIRPTDIDIAVSEMVESNIAEQLAAAAELRDATEVGHCLLALLDAYQERYGHV